jgi:hypothetical protein
MLDAPPTVDTTMVAPKWGVEYTENLTGSPKGKKDPLLESRCASFPPLTFMDVLLTLRFHQWFIQLSRPTTPPVPSLKPGLPRLLVAIKMDIQRMV